MTILHSATSPELEKLRSLGQAAKIRAIFVKPPAVFKARVNQVFTGWDSIAQVAFDGVTLGAYTDILPNMEIWIGTTEGACDVGTLRARKSATSTVIYFNESSDVKIMDNQYITGVLDFLPRARHIWVDKDGVAFVDRDVAYVDQHRYWLPVPILGYHAVAKLTGASVSVPFDGSRAWCIGDSIWKHDWSVLNGGAIVGSGGTNPQATFSASAPGTYWIRDRVTTWTHTKTNDGYRLVHVWDAAHPPSRVRVDGEFLSGSNQDGGFVAKLTILDNMDVDVPDRALCILFTEDYFNAQAGTLGQIAGRENILFGGWVRGESITESQFEGGVLDLEVAGLHWWLQNQESFPHGIEYISTKSQPADWVEMQDLDAQKVYLEYLLYRTTLTQMTDCYPMTGIRCELNASELRSPKGSIWSQLTELFSRSIMYEPHTDEYGRLFIEPHPNVTPENERSELVTVMEITKNDRALGLQFDHVVTPQTSQVDLSGIRFDGDVTTALTYFALSPGHVDKPAGRPARDDNYLFPSQAYAKIIAGLKLAQANAVIAPFGVELSQNNRLLGIAPYQYASITIDPADNPRGRGYSGLVIPQKKAYVYDKENGVLTVSYDLEISVTADLSADGDVPADENSNSPSMSGFPPLPALPPLPPPLLPITGHPRFACMLTYHGIVWTDTFAETDPTKIVWKRCDATISSAVIEAVHMFAANRAGRVYVASETGLWSFTLGELPQEMQAPEYSFIWALGCDRQAVDTLAILGKDFTNAQDGIFYGSSAGLSKTIDTPEFVWDRGGISFGMGKWLVTYPKNLYPLRVLRLSANADAIEYQGDGNLTIPYANPNAKHKRAGISSEQAFCYVRNSIFSNDGESEAVLTGITLNDEDGVAANPDGSVILARESTDAIPKISTDSGASWSTIASFPKLSGAHYSAIDFVKEGMYAWAAGTVGATGDAGVWLTDDQATSFWNKTGNLYELLGPDFKPRYLRCWL